jgi:hypothetical protein
MRGVHCGYPQSSAPASLLQNATNTNDDANNSTPQIIAHDGMTSTVNDDKQQPEVEDPTRRHLSYLLLRWLLSSATDKDECRTGFYDNSCIILLVVASVVFLIFTGCMLAEQIEAIATNTGKIARMKIRAGQAGATEYCPVTEEFNEMFGGTSSRVAWHWLLPLPVKFPRGMRKVVLGYEWDESYEVAPYREDSDEEEDLNGSSDNHDNVSSSTSALEPRAGDVALKHSGDAASNEPDLLEAGLIASNNTNNNGNSNKDALRKLSYDVTSASSTDIPRMMKKRTNSRNMDEQGPMFVDRTKGRLT